MHKDLEQKKALLITLATLGALIVVLGVSDLLLWLLPRGGAETNQVAAIATDQQAPMSKTHKIPLEDLTKEDAIEAAIEMLEPDYLPPAGFMDAELLPEQPNISYTLGYSYIDREDILDANFPTDVYYEYDFDVDKMGDSYATIRVLDDEGNPDPAYNGVIAFAVDYVLYEGDNQASAEPSEPEPAPEVEEPEEPEEPEETETEEEKPKPAVITDLGEPITFTMTPVEQKAKKAETDEKSDDESDNESDDDKSADAKKEETKTKVKTPLQMPGDGSLVFIDTSNDFLETALPLVYIAHGGSSWHSIYDYEFIEYDDAVTLVTYEIGIGAAIDEDEIKDDSKDKLYPLTLYKVESTVSKKTGKFEIEENKKGSRYQIIDTYELTADEMKPLKDSYSVYFE